MSVCPILRQQWSELLGLIFKGNTEMEFYVALLGVCFFKYHAGQTKYVCRPNPGHHESVYVLCSK